MHGRMRRDLSDAGHSKRAYSGAVLMVVAATVSVEINGRGE